MAMKGRILRPYPVMICWVDSAGLAGVWHARKEACRTKLSRCVTTGWLIRKTKRRLVVASSVSKYQFGEVTVVPRCAVEHVWKLEDPTRPRKKDG